MDINCYSCNTTLNETSIFCFNCGSRMKCSNCKAILINGAKFCSECGSSIESIQNSDSNMKNTVHYHRTKDTIICDVSLTNEVGKEGIKELIQNLANNQSVSYKKIENNNGNNEHIELSNGEVIENAEDNETTKKSETVVEQYKKDPLEDQNELPHIDDLEVRLNCSEPEWILVFAYYESGFGQKTFSRDTVQAKYLAKRKTENRSKNFAANWKLLIKKYISTISENNFRINAKDLPHIKALILGKEKGNQHLRAASKTKTKSNTNNTDDSKNRIEKPVAKRINKNTQSYTIVSSLDLKPKGLLSLKDFHSKHKTKNNFETNLVCIYYIQKILNETGITINHIYTCYKELSLKVPSLHQSLIDTKYRRGWIDTSNLASMIVTRAGENYIEHDLITKTDVA